MNLPKVDSDRAMISETLFPFVRKLAEKSAAVIVPYFANENMEVELKADETPVTRADRQAERVMRDLIAKEFPSHGIIGEEYGEEKPDAEFVWVLDPIDGTKSFAAGCPLFGTLICLLHQGKPIIGAINQPILNQFCFGDGRTTTCNGKPVRVREISHLSEASLLTTDIKNIFTYQDRGRFEDLACRVKMFRTWGDCYGYLLVASGWADIMVDPIMNPWDLLPLIPVIEGAGGVITTWDGSDPRKGNSIVAANEHIHGRVIEILNADTV
jgi:histidinol phosphatase-like enzyme (inositol monophosphatase family)